MIKFLPAVSTRSTPAPLPTRTRSRPPRHPAASPRGCWSCQCEDIQGDSSRRRRVVNEAANLFSGFSRKHCFAATLADLRGNVFHQDAPLINREHFAHEFIL